jgi:hypothetical protein
LGTVVVVVVVVVVVILVVLAARGRSAVSEGTARLNTLEYFCYRPKAVGCPSPICLH